MSRYRWVSEKFGVESVKTARQKRNNNHIQHITRNNQRFVNIIRWGSVNYVNEILIMFRLLFMYNNIII